MEVITPDVHSIDLAKINGLFARPDLFFALAAVKCSPKIIKKGRKHFSNLALRLFILLQTEPIVRLFDLLRKEDANCVTQADLKQMLNGILLSHPGLEFLQETPEFQERYVNSHLLCVSWDFGVRGARRKVDSGNMCFGVVGVKEKRGEKGQSLGFQEGG